MITYFFSFSLEIQVSKSAVTVNFRKNKLTTFLVSKVPCAYKKVNNIQGNRRKNLFMLNLVKHLDGRESAHTKFLVALRMRS